MTFDQGALPYEDTIQPWEQQPSEPVRLYRLFCLFRDLGPSRSVLAAYLRVRKSPRTERTDCVPGAWRRWVVQWHWRERADAWDLFIQHQKDEAELRSIEELDAELSTWRIERARGLMQRERITRQRIDRLVGGASRARIWNGTSEIDQVRDLAILLKTEEQIVKELSVEAIVEESLQKHSGSPRGDSDKATAPQVVIETTVLSPAELPTNLPQAASTHDEPDKHGWPSAKMAN